MKKWAQSLYTVAIFVTWGLVAQAMHITAKKLIPKLIDCNVKEFVKNVDS